MCMCECVYACVCACVCVQVCVCVRVCVCVCMNVQVFGAKDARRERMFLCVQKHEANSQRVCGQLHRWCKSLSRPSSTNATC